MKNYSYFFLGIVFPGLINFFAIPVFKRTLGEALYAEYNLLLTALLMSNMILVGWISHAIIRLASQAANKESFIQHSVWLSMIISTTAAALLAIGLSIVQGKILLSILSALLLIGMAVQLVLNGAAQSYLKAKHIMYSESIRVGLGFLIGYGLIALTGLMFSIEKLFLALVVSNFISCIVLYKGIRLRPYSLLVLRIGHIKNTAENLFKYGIYLMLWFLSAYALMYNDRYIIYYTIGKETAGHYTAMFDIINRSVTIAALPLLMSTFPILAEKYDKGNVHEAAKLLNKVLMIELIALPVTILAYWLFGYDVLHSLLKLPTDKPAFFISGLFILAGSIIGQIGMVVHKKMELRKETSKMFIMMFASFVIAALLNSFLIKSFGITGAGITFFCANLLYVVIVFFYTKNRFNTSASKAEDAFEKSEISN